MEPTSLHWHLPNPARLGHATLLVGGSSSSRTQVAEELITALEVAPADVLWAESAPAVRDLRQLLARLSLKPFQSPWVIAVCPDVHMWSAEAATTLLKTLEEPPAYAKLILLAAEDTSLLPTIQSRVRRIRLPVVVDDQRAGSTIPLLCELVSQPLSDALATVTTLAEQPGASEVIAWWIAGETDPDLRRTLLGVRTRIATHPVNRRLTLESLLVQYRANSRMASQEPV